MSFNPVPALRKEPMLWLKPWTKPDGTPRFGKFPPWYCPKCLKPFKGMAIKTHRETCGKDAGK